MCSDGFVDIGHLQFSDILPRQVFLAAIERLPKYWAENRNQNWFIRKSLVESYERVITTDFRESYWFLSRPQDVETTIHWCMLGGSFLADFAMDPAKPRIFAWGLSPVKLPAFHALKNLKGRDAERIPTAVCCPVHKIPEFIDRSRLQLEDEIILDYLAMAPAGIRLPANGNVPTHYLSSEGLVQFIVAGIDSPYMQLVERFLTLTGFPLMGITSGNLSGKGYHAARNQGTHKNIDEIRSDMGGIGIPILAGEILLNETADLQDLSIDQKYHGLHDYYESLPRREFAESKDLLPLSVTVCEPKIELGKRYFDVVRHGSLHASVIAARLGKFTVHVRSDGKERLEISSYE